jgi:GNAT superfamily N-acetyltransferase
MNLKRVDLHAVFVDPLYRRKGIAKASVNFMFQYARRLGCKMICVTDGRERFFEKLGFARLGTSNNFTKSIT